MRKGLVTYHEKKVNTTQRSVSTDQCNVIESSKNLSAVSKTTTCECDIPCITACSLFRSVDTMAPSFSQLLPGLLARKLTRTVQPSIGQIWTGSHQSDDCPIIQSLLPRNQLVPKHIWEQNSPNGPVDDPECQDCYPDEAIPAPVFVDHSTRTRESLTSSMAEAVYHRHHWQVSDKER